MNFDSLLCLRMAHTSEYDLTAFYEFKAKKYSYRVLWILGHKYPLPRFMNFGTLNGIQPWCHVITDDLSSYRVLWISDLFSYRVL